MSEVQVCLLFSFHETNTTSLLNSGVMIHFHLLSPAYIYVYVYFWQTYLRHLLDTSKT